MEHALLNDESELGQELVGWLEGCSKGGLEGQGGTEGHYPVGGRPANTLPANGGEAFVSGSASVGFTAPLFPNPAGVLKEIQSTLEGDRG